MNSLIRNMERFRQSKLIDFTGLKGAFPLPSITPSDLDFVVERHGRFLIGEIKLAGTPIPMGQQILLDQLFRGLPDVWMFEAEHNCASGEVIDIAQCVLVRARSRRKDQTYTSRIMTVLGICQLWTKTFSEERHDTRP